MTLNRQTALVTAAAGALGLATVDIAANALGAKVNNNNQATSQKSLFLLRPGVTELRFRLLFKKFFASWLSQHICFVEVSMNPRYNAEKIILSLDRRTIRYGFYGGTKTLRYSLNEVLVIRQTRNLS